MTAAELLRGLDKAATAGPWTVESGYHDCADGAYWRVEPIGADIHAPRSEGGVPEAGARLIATTRNLLPLLADYIAAGDRVVALARPEFDTAEARHAFSEAVTSLERARAALNAAAAKEVK